MDVKRKFYFAIQPGTDRWTLSSCDQPEKGTPAEAIFSLCKKYAQLNCILLALKLTIHHETNVASISTL